jgi:hypothetical protein
MRPSDTTRRDGYVPPCIPTRAHKVPSGPVHEIKHDGYRLQVRREGATVRLFTRRGAGNRPAPLHGLSSPIIYSAAIYSPNRRSSIF